MNEYFLTDTNGNFIYDQDDFPILHREDGPAFVWTINKNYKLFWQSRCEWWYLGKEISVSSQEEFEKWIRLKAFW